MSGAFRRGLEGVDDDRFDHVITDLALGSGTRSIIQRCWEPTPAAALPPVQGVRIVCSFCDR